MLFIYIIALMIIVIIILIIIVEDVAKLTAKQNIDKPQLYTRWVFQLESMEYL